MSDGFDRELQRARRHRGPLSERLGIVQAACRQFTPAYDAELDRFVARLRGAGAGSAAPGLGMALPNFLLPDQEGRLRRLDRLREGGPVVLAFHRGGWCDFCQIGLQALADIQAAIDQAGGRLVAVAPQRASFAASHLADAEAGFPMLVDMDGAYASSIGLTVPIDDALAAHLEAFGIDLADINGDSGRFLPIPATFVIGRDGVVVARHVDPDPRRRMDSAEVLQALARVS